MTVKVRVRNFQSIKDATLDIQGFTVVTGPNNSGKTAFMRAIRGAVQNTKGSAFVRQGSASTEVDLTFDDGHTLTWKKGAAKSKIRPTYIVDGGDPIYPGASVPDEVRALGIRPIKANGKDIWPQIAAQFHQVFLIDEPGSALAEAVADVERVGQLNEALTSAKKEHTKASSVLEVRRTDVDTLTKELAGFDGLDDVEVEVRAAETDLARAAKIRKAAEGVVALQARLQGAEAFVESLEGVEQIRLPPEVAFKGPQDTLEERDALLGISARLGAAGARVAHWSPLDGVYAPPAEEMAALRQTYDDLEDHRSLSKRLEAAKVAVDEWGTLEGVGLDADEAPATKLFSALGVVVDLDRRWIKARTQCENLENRVVEAEEEVAQAENDFLEYLAELGECPICGGSTETHGC